MGSDENKAAMKDSKKIFDSMSDKIRYLDKHFTEEIRSLNAKMAEHQVQGYEFGQIVNQTRNETIPMGFVYIQLPFQEDPSSLWDWAVWEQITQAYAGHFFRAEGDGSEPFGRPQTDAFQAHRVDGLSLESKKLESGSDRPVLSVTSSQKVRPSADDSGQDPRMANETRPKNYAVRIWKRIG